MKKRKRKPATTALRQRAERQVTKRKPRPKAPSSRLFHELEVHQVELELQNEELQHARSVAEAALERYTEVFDFAPIGYATLDRNGVILEINHAGATLLGAERARFVGTAFASFVAARSVFDNLMRTAMARTMPATCELDLARTDITIPIRITAAVLRRGQPTVLLAFEDVSERRAKEMALARSEHALREVNRRKDEFMAMLSHELRNPLSPIRTSVEVLRLAEPGSATASSAVDIIDRSTTHLTKLVDDLLDVTRITRGKVELRREPVDLIALVHRTMEDRRSTFTQRRLIVDTRVACNELWVEGDGGRLLQVLSNVLGNAEKFTPAGGKITVVVEAVDKTAVITIKDTGVGIAAEVIAELFEPFAQAPQAIDRQPGGLGLGLTAVKSLVELHGGRVSIRSAGLGQGTEVVITLPAVGRQAPAQARAAFKTDCPRRVLIVEDMRDTAHSLQRALELKGHTVEVAHDGRAGLERMESFKPEVVLCDLGLPDMDGFAFAMHVRAHVQPATYLIALTGYARPEDIARAKAAGFDRHVAKPAGLDDLEAALANVPEQRFTDTLDTTTLH